MHRRDELTGGELARAEQHSQLVQVMLPMCRCPTICMSAAAVSSACSACEARSQSGLTASFSTAGVSSNLQQRALLKPRR